MAAYYPPCGKRDTHKRVKNKNVLIFDDIELKSCDIWVSANRGQMLAIMLRLVALR